jgi:hypothetical protein
MAVASCGGMPRSGTVAFGTADHETGCRVSGEASEFRAPRNSYASVEGFLLWYVAMVPPTEASEPIFAHIYHDGVLRTIRPLTPSTSAGGDECVRAALLATLGRYRVEIVRNDARIARGEADVR